MASTPGVSRPPRRGGFLRTVAVLVVGAVLGVIALVVFRPELVVKVAGDRVAPTATTTVTATVTASPPADTTRLSLDVPDSCLDALRTAGASAGTVRDLVDALQGLRVNRARELADQLRQSNPQQLGTLANDCRQVFDQIGPPTPTP